MATIRHVPAEDETVDPSWELDNDDGGTSPYGLQDARSYGGGILAQKHLYRNGELWAVEYIKTFRTVKAAHEWLMKQANKT